MKISIKKTLSEIQREFNAKFPYLKLEFYTSQNVAGEGASLQQLVNVDQRIMDVCNRTPDEDLKFDGQTKVSTFERIFFEKFGINIQIFRKSGDSWIQTKTTESVPLRDQDSVR